MKNQNTRANMLSVGSKDSEILQLKQIINGGYNGEEQLELLTKFEISKSIKQFEILSKICELVPLTTTLLMIKDIISVFLRKLVTLLDGGNVLQNAELSKNILENLKTFWSLCSRQQNIVSSSQLFGKWHPLLLEEMTPLASLFIDLFISAHGHKEDHALWSRRLFSWLNFDLPDRAIKVALLEAEGHGRDGAEIAGPLLSHVLQRKFDNSSNPEYLLHFLLLKKWQGLAALSDVREVSKFIKAPPSFLAWLMTYWKVGSKYIPEDTTLKGAEVSRFLLQLKRDSVLESLTDVLQMAVFPEEDVEGQPGSGDISGSLLFVVDKKGDEQVDEIKTSGDGELRVKNKREKKTLMEDLDNHDSLSVVTPRKKRTASETNNSPERKGSEGRRSKGTDDETVSSPKKKRNKTSQDENQVDKNGVTGFFVDRGCSKSEDVKKESNSQVQTHSLSKDDVKPGKRRRSLLREESDDVDNDNENDDKELKPKRQKQNDETRNESENDSDKNEEEEADVISSHSLRSRNLAAAVLKKKHILISDPVASSYFVNNVSDTKPIQVFESPKASGLGQGKKTLLKVKDASVASPIRSSPRIKNLIAKKTDEEGSESESPLSRKTNSTPQKRTPGSPVIRGRIDNSKKGTGSESPLIKKGSESPLIKKGSESPLIKKGSESPLIKKRSESPLIKKGNKSPLKKHSTPQKQISSESPMKNGTDSSQKKSAKKTKVTPSI